jgi:hypothetical protein
MYPIHLPMLVSDGMRRTIRTDGLPMPQVAQPNSIKQYSS